MGVTVFINRGRSVVHKDAGGQAVAAPPDVCKTPSPGGPVPIPYVNIAKDADTSQGSKSVIMDSNPIMLKDSEFSVSMGDEAGTVGGVASNVNRGKAKFSTYSFDVKVEGKNVPRHLDLMLMNGETPNLMGIYRGTYGKVPGHWDIECVMKILCKKDPALVADLNKLNKLKVFEEVFWMDPYYDGTQWTTRKFPGGGYNSKPDKEIGLVTNGTCERGAVVVKHELIHQAQPEMLMANAEDEAYKKAEEWTIKHGLPTQAPLGYNFRQPGPAGTTVVNFSEVQRMVRDAYPVPAATSGTPPQCIGKTATGDSIMFDPTTRRRFTRPPQSGDSFPGPETRRGERDIDPKSLKCP